MHWCIEQVRTQLYQASYNSVEIWTQSVLAKPRHRQFFWQRFWVLLRATPKELQWKVLNKEQVCEIWLFDEEFAS